MDTEKTRDYYGRLTDKDICQCAYCQNYVAEIKAAYPLLTHYLDSMGVDIEKPFETMPLEPYEGYILYIGTQYVVIGSKEGFVQTKIEDVTIDIADSHPVTDIREEHFVIEADEIKLKWMENKRTVR